MKNELPLARPITPVAIPNDRAMPAYGAAMSGFWRLRPVVDRVRTVWAGNSARPYGPGAAALRHRPVAATAGILLGAEGPRVPDGADLRDVAVEGQAHGPVDGSPDLARGARDLAQVVGAGHTP